MLLVLAAFAKYPLLTNNFQTGSRQLAKYLFPQNCLLFQQIFPLCNMKLFN